MGVVMMAMDMVVMIATDMEDMTILTATMMTLTMVMTVVIAHYHSLAPYQKIRASNAKIKIFMVIQFCRRNLLSNGFMTMEMPNASLLYSLAVVVMITVLILKLIVMPSVNLSLVITNLVKARKGRRRGTAPTI